MENLIIANENIVIYLPKEQVEHKLSALLYAAHFLCGTGEEMTQIVGHLLDIYKEIENGDEGRKKL